MVPSPGDQDYQSTTDPFGKEVIISLTNGLHLYSGEGDGYILSSAFTIGHRVRSCLHSLPQYCPTGMTGASAISLWICKWGLELGGRVSWHLYGGALAVATQLFYPGCSWWVSSSRPPGCLGPCSARLIQRQ